MRKDKHVANPEDRDPKKNVEIVVDVRGEKVTVCDEKGACETYSRANITGRGTSTWLLLVLFAAREGTVEKGGPEVKKLNDGANRINLGNALMKSLRLKESPFIEGDASGTKFKSIRAENIGIDAMERQTRSLDDAGTDFLSEHGEDMPVIE
jgi:hypothetical protein